MRLVHKLRFVLLLPLAVSVAGAQNDSSNPVSPPVSYASVNQLNQMLTQLEEGSKATQDDLGRLRIERWKTDSGNKRQVQSNVESIQRNLQEALPTMISELRASPENLTSTFKVYRNLDALYDVFSTVVESAGAFGSKDEFQTLENDLSSIEKARHSFAERMETLSGAKETELARLRTEVRNAQAAAVTAPPKKIIVDDNEPPKKPVKKKTTAKSTKPSSSTPAQSTTGSTPPPPK